MCNEAYRPTKVRGVTMMATWKCEKMVTSRYAKVPPKTLALNAKSVDGFC